MSRATRFAEALLRDASRLLLRRSARRDLIAVPYCLTRQRYPHQKNTNDFNSEGAAPAQLPEDKVSSSSAFTLVSHTSRNVFLAAEWGDY